MKRALAPGVLVLLLALSGCVNVETSESRVEVTPGASGTYSDGNSTVVVEPLTTETSEAPAAPVEVTATPPAARQATSVLTGIQLAIDSYGIEVNAAQIKTASDYACDQLAAGVDEDSIIALTGDIPEQANRDLVQLAADEYCPIR